MTARIINPAADSDQNCRLSKDFHLSEFHCKDGTPVPAHLVPSLAAFVESGPQVVRTFFDARTEVVSGYRTPQHNKAVGGAAKSYHQYGHIEGREDKFACDLAVRGVEPRVVFEAILGLMRLGIIPAGGVGLYPWGVHIDNRGYVVEF